MRNKKFFKLILMSVKSGLLWILLLLAGCSFFDVEPVQIIKFSPNADSLADDYAEIIVEFTKVMAKKRLEQAFSFTEDGDLIDGDFHWANQDQKVKFSPEKKFLLGKEYVIRISTEAEDINGNNLKKEFVHKFYLGVDRDLPYIHVDQCSPYHDSYIGESNLRNPIVIEFSEPMNKLFPQNHFSIDPNVDGIFEWLSQGNDVVGEVTKTKAKRLRFTPTKDYQIARYYQVAVKESLTDLNGNPLKEGYTFKFYTSDDLINPEIDSIQADPIPGIALDPVSVTTGVEKDSQINIVFSKNMNRNDTESAISLTPNVDLHFTWNSDTELNIQFKENLSWYQVYKLSINKNAVDTQKNQLIQDYEYFFQVTGDFSIPPFIASIRESRKDANDFIDIITGDDDIDGTMDYIYYFNCSGPPVWIDGQLLDFVIDFIDYPASATDEISLDSLLNNLSFAKQYAGSTTDITIQTFVKRLAPGDTGYAGGFHSYHFILKVTGSSAIASPDDIIIMTITGGQGIKDINNNYMLASGTKQYFLKFHY